MSGGSSQWMYQSTGYQIQNSCRFDDGGTPKLVNTPSNASNRKTFTWSSWVKRSSLAGTHVLFGALDASGRDNFYFQDTDKFVIEIMGTVSTTTQVFRDIAAWYHIVVVVDTTQGTNTNRIKLYVNGARVTSFSTGPAYPSQNTDGDINNDVLHVIGKDSWASRAFHFDGYLSEVHFVDGTAYQADSFGEFNKYGQWVPIKPQVTYGTNGFSMLFNSSGNLGLTGAGGATDVGSNYGVTNLAAHDQMNDTPTNNFNVNNPLDEDYASNRTFSEGTLTVDSGTNHGSVRGTMAMSSGKWYMEWCNPTITDGNHALWCGVCANDTDLTVFRGVNIVNQTASNGLSIVRDDAVTNYSGVWAAGSVMSAAIDMDNRKIWLGLDNTYYGSGSNTNGDPAGAANPTHTLAADQTPDGSLYSFSGGYDLEIVSNFGQDSSFAGAKTAQGNTDVNGRGDFFYAPPPGFLALCTKNLPEPDIIPTDYFNTILYNGTGSGVAVRTVGFQPDLIWGKKRNAAQQHWLIDAVSGAGKQISSNNDETEGTEANGTAFVSIGFDTSSNDLFTTNNHNYVVWNWKAGNATLGTGDFTQGATASTCSRSVEAGFSIVKYTGSGSATTIGHGLSKAPEMMWVKNRTVGVNWCVYVSAGGMDATDLIQLNTSDAKTDTAAAWNDTEPTSTVFSVNNDNRTNDSSETFVAYCFHSVDDYSKVGSYLGNGNANGAFVHTGFRPAWVMLKKTGNAANGSSWCIHDNKRVGYNNVNERLRPNTNGVEDDDGRVELLSNGFKMRVTYQESNEADVEFIYIAFAETPFKYSNAR